MVFYRWKRVTTLGPYEALLPELAATSEERVSLQAVKVYLGVAGTVLGLIGSDFLVHQGGFKVMALAITAFSLVCQYLFRAYDVPDDVRGRVPPEAVVTTT